MPISGLHEKETQLITACNLGFLGNQKYKAWLSYIYNWENKNFI